MTLTITKVSGVLFVTDSGNTYPKAYFNATGSYQMSDDSASVVITIGTKQWKSTWENLRVGSSTPANVAEARLLLNAIFGS